MPPATRSRGSVPDVSREGLRGRRVPCPRSCCALGAGALSAAGPRRTGDCRAPPAGLCSFVGRSRRLRAHSPLPAHPSGHGGEPLQLPGAPCHPLPAVALRLTRLPRPRVRSSPPFAPAGVAPPGPLPPSFPHSHALSETAPLSPIPAPSILPLGSPASRFAANLRMGLTLQTFPSRLLQKQESRRRRGWPERGSSAQWRRSCDLEWASPLDSPTRTKAIARTMTDE